MVKNQGCKAEVLMTELTSALSVFIEEAFFCVASFTDGLELFGTIVWVFTICVLQTVRQPGFIQH